MYTVKRGEEMHFDIYCDESRQDLIVNKKSIGKNNRYTCFGGLMLPDEKRPELKSAIKALKDKHSVYGELKWDNVSHNKIDFYLELIDLFFSLDYLSFRTVIIDATEVNHDAFNDSDHELGYYKFYYQLIYHWISADSKYQVYTDFKTNKVRTRLNNLKRILNKVCHIDCILLIQALDSKESLPLQMQNVIMGAIGYRFNYGDDGQSNAKNQVITRIEHHLNHRIMPTPRGNSKFNIFKMTLGRGNN